MQLGWFPGVRIRQTSSEAYGQIYVPFLNWAMMIGTLSLVIVFESSDKLAGAYGAAVSTTMLMTTALLYRVMRVTWKWRPSIAFLLFVFFVIVDMAFFAANMIKIAEGGWIPLTLGAVIFTIMTTWRTGLDAMHRMQHRDRPPLRQFLQKLNRDEILRVRGTAIFLTRLGEKLSPLIDDHVQQNGALPDNIVALTVRFADRPRVNPLRRVHARKLAKGFWHLTVRFGFVEIPNVPATLHRAKVSCPFSFDEAIYFSERDDVTARKKTPRLSRWRRVLFSFLYRNSIHAADRFDLPARNFVQVGRRLEM